METLKKTIRGTVVIILFLKTIENYGMENKDENEQINQGETKTTPNTNQDSCCNEICQEINEEFLDNKETGIEEIWEKIKQQGIKIEKQKLYLKIKFPGMERIKQIRDKIFINFESSNKDEELDKVFTPFKNQNYIKNGTKLTTIKKTIFSSFQNKETSFSFCIIPQKNYDNIKIYFTCGELDKKIYASIEQMGEKVIVSKYYNNNKEEQPKEEQSNNNINSDNNNIIKEEENQLSQNFSIKEGKNKNVLKITFINSIFNKGSKDKIYFYCSKKGEEETLLEDIFAPYSSKIAIKNGTKITEIKKGVFKTDKEKDFSIKFLKGNCTDFEIYFTIDGEEGKFYADRVIK